MPPVRRILPADGRRAQVNDQLYDAGVVPASSSTRRTVMRRALNYGQTLIRAGAATLAAGLIAVGLATVVFADVPGRGRTAAFEVNCLRFIINHHASATRMTELAAGTDPTRDEG